MRCDNCIHWHKLHEFRDPESESCKLEHIDDYSGQCKRYPPQLDSVFAREWCDEHGEGAESSWNCWQQPITTGQDCCGEFSGICQ